MEKQVKEEDYEKSKRKIMEAERQEIHYV